MSSSYRLHNFMEDYIYWLDNEVDGAELFAQEAALFFRGCAPLGTDDKIALLERATDKRVARAICRAIIGGRDVRA